MTDILHCVGDRRDPLQRGRFRNPKKKLLTSQVLLASHGYP
ncbi:unnamed protein product [Brassica oleracea var. botrytis]